MFHVRYVSLVTVNPRFLILVLDTRISTGDAEYGL